MPKQIMKKELVFINFKKQEFRFYNVELLSVGFNELHMITHYGNLGNKGKESIVRFSDFNEATKASYKKIYEKKSDGYMSVERIAKTLEDLYKNEMKEKKNPYVPKNTSKNVSKNAHVCGVCGKKIDSVLYKKIDDWARGEGGWDHQEDFIGYKKVLCIDCQIDHDIFKKKHLIGVEKNHKPNA